MTDDHDAGLKVVHTRHGAIVTWGWTDGRRTVTPTEHKEIKRTIREAELRFDPEALESQTNIAKIWMGDDETIREIEWADA